MLHDDAAVHEDDAVRNVAGKAHLVGDDDHGHVLGGKPLDDLQDLGRELGVKGARGLVKEHDLRVHGKRAGNARTLLLAAGELAGHLVLVARKAHLGQQGPRLLLHLRAVALLHADRRVHDVSQHREVRKQVVVLKDQAKALASLGQKGLVAVGAIFGASQVAIGEVARVHALEQRHAAQQRGLSTTGRADDGHHLAGVDGKGDVPQDLDLAKALLHVVDRDHRVLV